MDDEMSAHYHKQGEMLITAKLKTKTRSLRMRFV